MKLNHISPAEISGCIHTKNIKGGFYMLNELLQDLKKALQDGNKKEADRIVKALNRLGMDNYTIKVLLKEV